MLVIARKTGQTLLIGDDIEVTVSAIRGDQVRLAINAPREIAVLRKEVVDQVAEGNLAAVTSAPDTLDLPAPPQPAPDPGKP
jgi:carbon storage regulator